MPECLDALQLAYEQPTEKNKVYAEGICDKMYNWDSTNGKDIYDARQKVRFTFPPVTALLTKRFTSAPRRWVRRI